MSNQAPADGRRNDRTRPGWFVSGIIAFAALMMILLGSLHALSGFLALFEDDHYVVGPSGLLVNVDYTVYGVVHLAIGITMVMAGWGLFFRRTWARVVTVIVAMVERGLQLGVPARIPGVVRAHDRARRAHHLGGRHARRRRRVGGVRMTMP